MQTETFAVEPVSLSLGELTISALIEKTSVNNIWEVVVIFSRSPGPQLMEANDVEAKLFDAQDNSFTVVERPSDALIEAGGSLRVSANARFCFQGSGKTPLYLEVAYKKQRVRFRVVPIQGN
jgi:hypothetical protein